MTDLAPLVAAAASSPKGPTLHARPHRYGRTGRDTAAALPAERLKREAPTLDWRRFAS